MENRQIFPAPSANYEKDDSIFFIGLPGGADFVAATKKPGFCYARVTSSRFVITA